MDGVAGGSAVVGGMRSDARRNRERLLSAAFAVFTETGDDTSLEAIARRAGVGIGTLYRHFPNRQALLEAVYRDQVDAICARAKELAADPPPGGALTAWLRDLIAFSLTKRSLTAQLLAGSDHEAPVFSACRSEMHDSATMLLAQAQRDGEVRAGIEVSDLMRLTHAIVVAVERLPDRAAQADRMLTLVLGGILANSPA